MMSSSSRSALTKEKVKLARQSLLAKQQYPSVDAVRIELGNTGSKTTIHKYLKELEQEAGEVNLPRLSLSEKLQYFVAQLAEQLENESNEKIEQIKQDFEQQEQLYKRDISGLKNDHQLLEKKYEAQTDQLKQLEQNYEQLKQELILQTNEKIKQNQYVIDLHQQLEQNKQHKLEILEKFEHAQKSLEHYRESVKEQRQQDLRRHDHAIQHLQHEIRQLQQTIAVDRKQISTLTQENLQYLNEMKSLQQKNQQDLESWEQTKTELLLVQQHSKHSHLKAQDLKQDLDTALLKINQLEEALDQYQNMDEENKLQQQQLLVLQTELNLQQKMYNDLLNAIAIQKNTNNKGDQ